MLLLQLHWGDFDAHVPKALHSGMQLLAAVSPLYACVRTGHDRQLKRRASIHFVGTYRE
jgi:hypothetical protein